ncbi:MAG TPA: (d)CMP kinase [Candidatus Limnocylindrales bacterium]|nr:(d)CMP kinase [Candidatus Limnocylindrales bacterium]
MSDAVRIHKALADAGVASRRRSEQLVIDGRVTVNGTTAGVGQLVDPARDVILVNGRRIEATQRRLYLALAKPAGVTSTVSDRHAGTTVLDLVPPTLRHGAARLYPVGRLDRDSEGLLLLTNDGAWAQRMLHPSHGIEREYAVAVDQPLSDRERRQLERGIEMEEGTARLVGLRPATATEIRRLSAKVGGGSHSDVWYRVTLRQGMKRQIRRMFSALGIPVRRLVRVRFGTLMLGDMAIGDVRPVSARERGQLEQLVGGPEVEEHQPGLIVSIDGPGGSGKSTVGARAASELGYRFCDTGVLYRGLTWLAMHRGADLDDPQALVGLVGQLELAPDADGRYTRLLIDGREVTDELHTAEVDREVSRVSQHAPVRAALLPVQQALASFGRIIMAGRDIGTVVLPNANPKLYLDVSIAERARRRAVERGVADDARAVAEIEEDLRHRDDVDSTREASPLRIPDGALRVRTDGLTLDETVAQVVDMIREAERPTTNGD